MSGGDSSPPTRNQTTTTVQNNEPPAYAKPALEKASKESLRLYDEGKGFKPFQESLVVDFSDPTKQMQSGLLAKADQFEGDLTRPMDFARDTLDRGGYNDQQTAALGQLQNIATGGAMGTDDTAFRNVLAESQQAAVDAVNDMAMRNGRVGSAAHQGIVAKNVGDVTSRALMGQLAQDRARQDNAIQSLFNAGQQGQTNMMGAANYIPAAFDATMAADQVRGGVGSMYEDLATRELNDEARLFDANQNEEINRLANFSALASGAGRMGGTSTSTATGPGQYQPSQPSALQRGLGGAMMGFGGGGGLLGAGLGAGLGLLF